MNDVFQPGPFTQSRAAAANDFVDLVRPLLNMVVVEGHPGRIDRDPTGWVLSFDLTGAVLTGGTSGATGTPPPGTWSLPTLTVAGPPTWTPASGTYPIEWSTGGILYAWSGAAWTSISTAVSGSVTFGTTGSVSTPPSTQLVIPVLTVSGPPTYTGTKGEVLCDGVSLYQYTGSTWSTYYATSTPLTTTVTTANTNTPVTTQTTTATSTGTPAPGFGINIVQQLTPTTGGPVPVATSTTTFVTGATPSTYLTQQQYSVTDHGGTYPYLTILTTGTTAAVTQPLPTAFGSTIVVTGLATLNAGVTVTGTTTLNGAVVVRGPLDFGTTGATATPTGGRLVLPVMTVPGPPTYASPLLGEIVADSNDAEWYYDGAAWVNLAGSATAPTNAAAWVKVTKTHTDFNDAGSSHNFTILTLTAKQVLSAAVVKHSASFTGGALTSYMLSLGTALGTVTNNFDVFQAPGATVFKFDDSNSGRGPQNFSTTANLTATATASGALNTATAGSVDFWLLISTLP